MSPKFLKMCPRCFAEDYRKLVVLADGEYVCDQCITVIEWNELKEKERKAMLQRKESN